MVLSHPKTIRQINQSSLLSDWTTKHVWTHQSVVAFNSHEYPIPAGFSWCAIPKNAWVIATKLLGVIPTPLKNMSSSVGIILPNIWKVIKHGFQTTNQKSVAKSKSSFSGAFPQGHSSPSFGCVGVTLGPGPTSRATVVLGTFRVIFLGDLGIS